MNTESVYNDCSDSAQFPVGRYAVLYFDLMGVKKELFKGIGHNENVVSSQKQDEINRVSVTIRRFLLGMQSQIDLFRESPGKLYDRFMCGESVPNFDAHRQGFVKQAESLRCGVQQGSDTSLLYVCLDSEAAVMFLWSCMNVFPLFMIKALSDHVLIRGGFTIGTAWEIKENCLFGPVFVRASEIESKEADYPRIIVDEPFGAMCASTLKSLALSDRNLQIRNNPFSRIFRDSDGLLVFDYLRDESIDAIVQLVGDRKEAVSYIDEAVRYAGDQLERFRREGDDVLSGKYEKLISYMNFKLRRPRAVD